MDIKTGVKVQFHKLRNGKRVGLDEEIYTIKDINFNDWGACDILVECDGYECYTSHEAIELASDTAIKQYEAQRIRTQEQAQIEELRQPQNYKQLTIFDLLEVV